MSTPRIVIAGGGLAAVRTAQTLRGLGHSGEIVLLSAERELPYDRPPLSKAFLAGELPEDGIRLIDQQTVQEQKLTVELGARVVALDRAARRVTVQDGRQVAYDKLVIATGAEARTLPVFAERDAVFSLRTADDSRRLATYVREGRSLAVVGAGFIGLEVAATARKSGCPVTVIEALDAPLLGAVGPDIAGWLQSRHAAEGVAFRCGVTVGSVSAAAAGVRLHLSDGSTVDADAVVVGVGVVRQVGWLADAGLEVSGGLVCDTAGRTNDPDVFGAGDIVCHRTARGVEPVGHWTAAVNSARRVAHAVLDLEVPEVPDDGFFWSDQYNLRLQGAGRIEAAGEMVVVSGALADDTFVAHFKTGDRITGVFASNSSREFLRHRMNFGKAQLAPAQGGAS